MKIFISHSYDDIELADMIKKKLMENDFSVLELDNNQYIGKNIASSIEKKIKEADAYIILLTKSYENSKWADLEQLMIFDSNFASIKNKKIYPIVFDKSVKIPSLLKNITYADLSDKENRDGKINTIISQMKNSINGEKELNYRHLKGILREQEELLKIKENEYLLQRNKQEKLRNMFQSSFLIVTIVSLIVSLVFFLEKYSNDNFSNSTVNTQSLIFYFLGFLTAIIPSLYIIIKQKNNGK